MTAPYPGAPDFIEVGPATYRMFQAYWDKELAKRHGVDPATIARFRKLGWLPRNFGLAPE